MSATLGQQHPVTDVDRARSLDPVGRDPLADGDAHLVALGVLLEESVRGLVREYDAPPAHPPCRWCRCLGVGERA